MCGIGMRRCLCAILPLGADGLGKTRQGKGLQYIFSTLVAQTTPNWKCQLLMESGVGLLLWEALPKYGG